MTNNLTSSSLVSYIVHRLTQAHGPKQAYSPFFPGEAHLQDPKLVGSPRDLEGHEIRLAAILGRHPQAPAREAPSLAPGRASGSEFWLFSTR